MQVNGVSAGNVTLSTLSVYPQRQNNSTVNPSPVTGYQVSTSITVAVQNTTTDNLAAVLSAASAVNPNITTGSVYFSQSPQSIANSTAAARVLAIADAKATAQAYAKVILHASKYLQPEAGSFSAPVLMLGWILCAALPPLARHQAVSFCRAS